MMKNLFTSSYLFWRIFIFFSSETYQCYFLLYTICHYIISKMKSGTLNEAVTVIEGLVKKSKPATSTTVKSAIVALYTADAQG